mmetsp:Transcript_42617/g.70916  ORF Transcript_42617/g.70916 Transcript_42617/m.70916 type:complete len:315 (-) Transcript_42617:6256-7200(-)
MKADTSMILRMFSSPSNIRPFSTRFGPHCDDLAAKAKRRPRGKPVSRMKPGNERASILRKVAQMVSSVSLESWKSKYERAGSTRSIPPSNEAKMHELGNGLLVTSGGLKQSEVRPIQTLAPAPSELGRSGAARLIEISRCISPMCTGSMPKALCHTPMRAASREMVTAGPMVKAKRPEKVRREELMGRSTDTFKPMPTCVASTISCSSAVLKFIPAKENLLTTMDKMKGLPGTAITLRSALVLKTLSFKKRLTPSCARLLPIPAMNWKPSLARPAGLGMVATTAAALRERRRARPWFRNCISGRLKSSFAPSET